MNRLCPECLGPLEVRDGAAHCTVHGGHYQILFWREGSAMRAPAISPAAAAAAAAAVAGPRSADPSAPPVSPKSRVAAAAMAPPASVVPRRVTTCANHDHLPAIFVCRRCRKPICDLCAFPQNDGARLCPACSHRSVPEPTARRGHSAVRLAVENQTCRQHSRVAAAQICQLCGAPMCATCDFLLPGNFHVCPVCAVAPPSGLSPKRKKMLRLSFIAAGASTLGLVGNCLGVLLARNLMSTVVLGLWLFALVLIPSVAGLALGAGVLVRRNSHLVVWMAVVWNGLLVGGFFLFSILGMLLSLAPKE